MSLMIAAVWPSAATLAVDTIGCELRDRTMALRMSKVQHIPHAKVAFAARGCQAYLSMLWWVLTEPRPVEDCDEAMDRLDDLLEFVQRSVREQAVAEGVDVGLPGAGSQLAIIGFSARAQAMVGRMCEIHNPMDPTARFQVHAMHANSGSALAFAPWEPEMGSPPDISLQSGIEDAARRQVAFLRKSHGVHPSGGILQVLHMTKDQTTISQVCDLGDVRPEWMIQECR